MLALPALLRAQLHQVNWLIESAVDGMTPQELHAPFAGTAGSMASVYCHIVGGEDFHTQELGGGPMIWNDWHPRLGFDVQLHQTEEWAKTVMIPDLPAWQEYARLVYVRAEAFLGGLTADAMAREVDFGYISGTVGQLAGTWMVFHAVHHCGELSAMKGMLGKPGLPF